MPVLRVGRKVGRTIYLQGTDEPSDANKLIGLMDSRSLAQLVVTAVNRHPELLDAYLDGKPLPKE